MTNLATLLVGFGMFGSFVLIPQLAEAPDVDGLRLRPRTPPAPGLLMLPGAHRDARSPARCPGSLGARFGSTDPARDRRRDHGGSACWRSALDHSTTAAILRLERCVLSVGIGLAFAAMPNLIVEAVPPEQTGEATGFNALVRSVGSSLGSQVTSSVLAAQRGRGQPRRPPTAASTRRLRPERRRRGDRRGHRARHPAGRAGTTHLPVADEVGAAAPLGRARLRGGARMTLDLPKRSDAVRNRASVLAAAAEVFAEHGLDAGMPEVAARAGVGKATVYRSFPTKDHLFAAILPERLDWFERRAREAAAEPDAGAALRAMLLEAAERQAADAALAGSLVPLKRSPQFDEVRRRAAAALDELVQRGIEQGSLRPDARSEEVRHLLTGAWQVLRESGETDLAAWRRYTELVVDAFARR